MAHSFHHLIPHANKWFKKRHTREAMRAGLELCKECHKTIHELVGEKDLGRNYNTMDKLLAHAEIAKYVAWKRKRRAT
jgi:hypothetical protein